MITRRLFLFLLSAVGVSKCGKRILTQSPTPTSTPFVEKEKKTMKRIGFGSMHSDDAVAAPTPLIVYFPSQQSKRIIEYIHLSFHATTDVATEFISNYLQACGLYIIKGELEDRNYWAGNGDPYHHRFLPPLQNEVLMEQSFMYTAGSMQTAYTIQTRIVLQPGDSASVFLTPVESIANPYAAAFPQAVRTLAVFGEEQIDELLNSGKWR